MICLLDNTKICLPICQLEVPYVWREWISINLLLDRKPWRVLSSFWYLLEQWSIRRETFPVVDLPHQILFLNLLLAKPMLQSMTEICPSEVTPSQVVLVRSSLESANRANMRRRIGRKRTVIPPQHLVLPANVDPVNLPEIVQKLESQRHWSPLKVTRRNVDWNLLTNWWIGVREKGHLWHG